MPKCPYCSHDTFTTSDFNLDDDTYDLIVICCTKCDSIISVIPPYNVGKTLGMLTDAFLGLKTVLKSSSVVNDLQKKQTSQSH